MKQAPNALQATCADGVQLAVSHYPSALNQPLKGTIIVASALGVPQQLYRKFAEFWAADGYQCLTFDYRGTYASAASTSNPVLLEDWGRQDIAALITLAQSLNPQQQSPAPPLCLVGHSIGGQVCGLAPNAPALAGLVLVAASAPYWRRWDFPTNLAMLLFGRVLLPGLCLGRRQFPGRFAGLGNAKIPTAVARRWGQWMAEPEYLFSETFSLDTSLYRQLERPLLSFDFDDDAMAPAQNVHALLTHFPRAKIDSRSIQASQVSDTAIGHMGYFRENCRASLWRSTQQWLEASMPISARY